MPVTADEARHWHYTFEHNFYVNLTDYLVNQAHPS
jgi:hypothetical protein